MTFTRGFRLHTLDGDTYDGAAFPSGRFVILDHPERGLATATTSMEELHTGFPSARVEWNGPAPVGWDNADMTCPHCPDGHTPPDGGSQPWAAWVGPERDGDGQPTTIHVARSAGAHVAESDAQWIRDRLNGDGR